VDAVLYLYVFLGFKYSPKHEDMKKTILSCLLAFGLLSGYSQYSPFIIDDFTDTAARIDLSEKIIRSGFEEPVSAFEIVEKSDNNNLTYTSIHLGSEGTGNGSYSFDNGDYMTHTCIDYAFPQEIDRTNEDTVLIEFDAIFKQKSGSGESNRLVVFLIHSYPDQEPSVGDFQVMEGHPFGRPAYNVRILPGSYGMFMAYGGGEEEEGVFEIVNNEHWLPGFSSAAGGGTMGQGDPYPISSWNEIEEGANTVSADVWKHYTIKLTPSRLSVFIRDSEADPSTDEQLLFMEMPEDGELQQINEAHGTFVNALPPNYHWFETINALRFFWRAAGDNDDFYIANVQAGKSGEPITTFAEFRSTNTTVAESDGTYNLRVELSNASKSKETTADVVLASGDSTNNGNYETQTLTFPAGSDDTQTITINITPDDDVENDTVVFELQNITGGNLPSVGKNNTFTMVIEDETTNITSIFDQKIIVYPVPVKNRLNILTNNNNNQNAHLEIYAITGLKIMEINNYDYKPVLLNDVPNGIYILKLNYSHQTITKRFSVKN